MVFTVTYALDLTLQIKALFGGPRSCSQPLLGAIILRLYVQINFSNVQSTLVLYTYIYLRNRHRQSMSLLLLAKLFEDN